MIPMLIGLKLKITKGNSMDQQQKLSSVEVRHYPRIGCQINGDEKSEKIDGDLRIVTEAWNRVAAVPYIVYMPEKDRLLMLVSCDYPHRPFVLWSDDHGVSWTNPMSIERESDDPSHHVGVSLTYLGQGKVIFSVEGASFCVFISEDFGQTWSEPVAKPPIAEDKPWIQWDPWLVDKDADGQVSRLVEAGYSCVGDVISGGESQAVLRFSFDEGQTWSPSITVPEWKGVNEVALIRAANGDIVAACRTGNPERFKNEIDHYEGLGISISKDNGQAWSELNTLYEYGRHHPSMVLLPGGEIVMTYVVRKGCPYTDDGFPQFGVEAVISRDNGEAWDFDHRYILAEWVGNRKGDNAWWPSCQGTSSVHLPDGAILTAFGTGYRTQPNEQNMAAPRDVGLIRWKPKLRLT